MNSIQETWSRMGAQARAGLVIGLLLIVALMIAVGVWAYRPNYQVLFADLAARDAAAMTAELDKLKTPYQLGEGGNTILVPQEMVYKTRLKLMGNDLPLHGAVGFEVFNNADFGMTEFVQKVNYQRAIQGELTRTILSIDDIAAARVHLAIPEQGLFKKALAKPKASVTLTMKPGRVLAPEQVFGIQRLVAASVPDIASGDVTLLDQHGVALTRVSAGDPSAEGASTQLDAKRGAEDYLLKKVSQVLDRTFGAGEAIATVDLVLNLDQSRVTTEEVLPARSGAINGAPTGVVVRERHAERDGDTTTVNAAGSKPSNGSASREADYQVGRRTEQLAVASGTIKRMTIAVVVKQRIAPDQLEKIREVVALAVGLNAARGDAIVVNSLEELVNPHIAAVDAAPAAAAQGRAETADVAASVPDPQSAVIVTRVLGALLAVAIVGVLAALWLRRRDSAVVRLSEAERAIMLDKVRAWIASGQAAAAGERK